MDTLKPSFFRQTYVPCERIPQRIFLKFYLLPADMELRRDYRLSVVESKVLGSFQQ